MKYIPILLALLACTPTAEESERVWESRRYHATQFARTMGVQHYTWKHTRVWTLECSGLLNGKPVRFDCDGEGCSWVLAESDTLD